MHRVAIAHGTALELTSVPIALADRAPGGCCPAAVTSNTMIGSSLSMQNVIAVESITFRPRLSTSM